MVIFLGYDLFTFLLALIFQVFKDLDDDSHEVKHCFFQNTKLLGGRWEDRGRGFDLWSSALPLSCVIQGELFDSFDLVSPQRHFFNDDLIASYKDHGENNAVENLESSVSL